MILVREMLANVVVRWVDEKSFLRGHRYLAGYLKEPNQRAGSGFLNDWCAIAKARGIAIAHFIAGKRGSTQVPARIPSFA
jgi:hypothetical protein